MTRFWPLLTCWMVISLGPVAMASASSGLEERLLTELSVINPIASARSREVVGQGVPFARGSLQDRDLPHLLVRDRSGARVPAQFHVTERWTPDPSIRFLHVVLSATVAANGRSSYRLLRADEAVEPIVSPTPPARDLAELTRLFGSGLITATVQGIDGVWYRLQDVEIRRLDIGPIRRRYLVTGRHLPPAGRGLRRDLFWSRVVITRYPASGQWLAEWELCNSYPMRPLGTIAFRSFQIMLRHGAQEPQWIWKGERWDIPENGRVGVRYRSASDGEVYRSEEVLKRIPRGLFANGRVGSDEVNLLAALKRSWEISPKALEADREWLRIWVLPPGEWYLVDGTRTGVEFVIDRNVRGDDWPVLERYYEPLGVLVDPETTRRSRAFGDFGALRVLKPNDPWPRPRPSNFTHDWAGFGDAVRNTHQTGSPRNSFSYLLPYYQTGDPSLLRVVEDQFWTHKQRPYHWTTPERRFVMSDYPGDHLYEGPFHWRYSGPGATARKKLPPEVAAQQARCVRIVEQTNPETGRVESVEREEPCTYGFTGYDPEHFTIDDLRDIYRSQHDPTAREYLLDACQGLLSLNEIRGSRDAVISARVLGWVLRGLLDAYRISADEDFWNGATRLVEKALERDGQRRRWQNGAWAGWQPLIYRGEVKKGLTNYDHFKGWMSAVGGYALYEYLDLLDARLARGLFSPFAGLEDARAHRERVHRFVLDTAELILELSYLPGRGFIYNVDLYADGMVDPATGEAISDPKPLTEHLADQAGATGGWRNFNGVATWNAAFLSLVAAREGDARFRRPVEEIVAARRNDRGGILSNPWYQLALELVDSR